MYQEKQKFPQKWLLLILYMLLLLGAALFIFVLINQLASWNVALLPLVGVLSLTLLFHSMELQTIIESTKICYRFFPIHMKYRCLNKTEIEEIAIVSYDPLGDYGGWGIRYGRNGKTFTTAGHFGIKLLLVSGKTILIGTQRPEEVLAFLSKTGYAPRPINLAKDAQA